jgi:hypothetical protein
LRFVTSEGIDDCRFAIVALPQQTKSQDVNQTYDSAIAKEGLKSANKEVCIELVGIMAASRVSARRKHASHRSEIGNHKSEITWNLFFKILSTDREC